jgi:hypothetical protein
MYCNVIFTNITKNINSINFLRNIAHFLTPSLRRHVIKHAISDRKFNRIDMIFVKITLQYIDKFKFCVKILCFSGLKLPLKSRSAESEFPRNCRDSSGHNKVGKTSNQKQYF